MNKKAGNSSRQLNNRGSLPHILNRKGANYKQINPLARKF